jgi:hypothetical protein
LFSPTTSGSPLGLVSYTGSVVVTYLPSPKVAIANEGESPLKQTNVTEMPNVDSIEHRRLNVFSSELFAFNDVLIEFQQDEESQMDFVVVPPT